MASTFRIRQRIPGGVTLRIVYNDGKLFISIDKEQMENIKKTWPQPIEINKAWVPHLIKDIGEVNLQMWRESLEK